MYGKLIKHDIARSKVSSLTIVFFILFTTFLVSTASIVSINLVDSINHFTDQAQSPHYLQMHLGEFDRERMANFAQSHANVADYQAMEYINIDNNDLVINEQKYLDNSQDNGFSQQSPNFDFLLDLNNQVVEVEEGQVYVPLTYYLSQEIKPGDRLRIHNLELQVMGPIRDSQMNSTLSSSKRFLVHANDLAKIRQYGQSEYLIEFLLHDLSQINEFQGDYGQAQLENNGPSITYAIIKMINGISDGIMLVILLLVAIFVLLISFLCIRFTLLSTMEEDYQQIGFLKGIGLRVAQIKKIYLGKYLLLTFLGALLGFLLSLVLSSTFLKNIYLYMGKSRIENLSYLGGLLAATLVFLIILLFVNLSLNRFKWISPVQAMRGIRPNQAQLNKCPYQIRSHPTLSLGPSLGIIQLLRQAKIYLSLVLILVLALFMILLPRNIASSLESRDFVKYMGIGDVDILISQQSLDQAAENKQVEQILSEITGIEKSANLQQKSYEILLDNGEIGRLWISQGDQESFPLQYVQGHAPQADSEIALSYLIAKDLQLEVGDDLSLIMANQAQTLQVSGIYSDITNGGKTGKVIFHDPESPTLRQDWLIQLKENQDETLVLKQLQEQLSQYRIHHVDDYRQDLLGETIASIQSVANLSMLISLALILLIAVLFTHLLVIRERRQTSIMKAIGLYNRQIAYPYFFASGVVLVIGLVLGMLLLKSLGQSLASLMMESFGVANFQFTRTSSLGLIILILLVSIAMYLGTYLASHDIYRTDITDYIKE